MSLLELRKIFLAVLLASFMALGMAACSSSGDSDDSASDDSASGESQSYEECKAACGDGDLDCREMCVVDAPL